MPAHQPHLPTKLRGARQARLGGCGTGDIAARQARLRTARRRGGWLGRHGPARSGWERLPKARLAGSARQRAAGLGPAENGTAVMARRREHWTDLLLRGATGTPSRRRAGTRRAPLGTAGKAWLEHRHRVGTTTQARLDGPGEARRGCATQAWLGGRDQDARGAAGSARRGPARLVRAGHGRRRAARRGTEVHGSAAIARQGATCDRQGGARQAVQGKDCPGSTGHGAAGEASRGRAASHAHGHGTAGMK